jgi:acetyl esterase/lipase
MLLLAAAPWYPDKTRLLVYRDDSGREVPIRTRQDWLVRRAHILENMQEVMGPLPGADRRPPLQVRTLESVRETHYTRSKILLLVEADDWLPAWLLVPHAVRPADAADRSRAAAVLVLHQTTRVGKDEPAGLAGNPDLHIARHLAERGYVTLAPDYPGYGEYRCDPYARGYASATMKGIWNHMRCIDYLQSLPEVDGSRIGAIGHSLGGHNSIFVAAFDERIACVVSNCGFTSFPRYMAGNLAGWSHQGYMPRIRDRYQLQPERMPFDFPEVVAALAPRPFLACAPVRDDNFDVQGVRDCLAAAREVYALLGVPERLAAEYPECGHQFPEAVRKAAYAWLDRWLQR